MKISISLMLVFVITLSLHAQTGSEILLFDLKIRKNKITLSKPRNITNHKGYDNQPSFHIEAPLIYYSSFNDEGRADIKSFNCKTLETKSVTQTSEREYSPTLTPDKQSLSCIIQRENGAQDLGKYPVEGGDPSIIIDNLIVGYHAWADNSHLALFVLGEPNSLHYLRLPTKEDTILAENIGRSLHKVPGERSISFVHKVSADEWLIKKINTETLTLSTITNTLPAREDIAWTSDGKIISSDGNSIFYFDTLKEKKWMKVYFIEGEEQLKGITRLAINSKNDKVAIVIAE